MPTTLKRQSRPKPAAVDGVTACTCVWVQDFSVVRVRDFPVASTRGSKLAMLHECEGHTHACAGRRCGAGSDVYAPLRPAANPKPARHANRQTPPPHGARWAGWHACGTAIQCRTSAK